MTDVPVSEARARLGDIVDTARTEKVAVFLTRHGHRVAAIIAAQRLEQLLAAEEDLADLRAAAEARAEMADNGEAIPWAEVKADLGLV